MPRLWQRAQSVLWVLLFLRLSACARSKAGPSPEAHTKTPPASERAAAPEEKAFRAPTGVTAKLTESFDIEVRWETQATESGGSWIEFATPGADFMKLDVAWPETKTFRHRSVAPE